VETELNSDIQKAGHLDRKISRTTVKKKIGSTLIRLLIVFKFNWHKQKLYF